MDKHPVGLAQRLLSYLIICLIAGQPVFPAVAATINPVTPGTQMDQAGNGVPVVNIATPNQAGISHNQYQDYNVGKEGLILNNATGQMTQTQLGGIIQNNPNLRAGQEATGIINEVIGGNRSQLQGYTEVAGKAANVMVANPYGITCNGCGFINTPNATLTTGKPQFDAAGNLLALDVSKGTITVEGQGLDASKTDALSIIARATEVNAGIHAKDLKVTVGANRVSSTGAVTPIAGEGAAPVVAVDTGALGGMYANRIHLVSSDKGVGVNLGNLNARQGDITLDASGKLVVNNSLASGDLSAQADSVVLSGEHKSGGATQVNSRSDITIANGKLASDREITLNGSGKLTLNNGQLTAGNDIALNAGAVSMDAASEANAGGAIRASAGADMGNAGKLTAGRDIALSAGQVSNSGQITANGDLNARASSLNNSGNIQAQRNIQLDLGSFTHSGQMLAGAGLTATTGDAWIDGMLSSGTDQAWTSRNTFNIGRNGQLLSSGNLALESGTFSNAGTVNGKQAVALSSQQFYGQQGSSLASGGNLELVTQQLQSAGQITSQKDLTFKGGRFETLAGGQLQSEGNMLLQANNSLTLSGTQAAKGALVINTGTLTHSGSTKGNTVTLGARQIDTSGNIQADGAMLLTADNIVQQAGGALLAQNNLQLNALNFTNRGSLDSDALTLAIVGNIDNQTSGKITARNGLNSTSDSFNNAGQVAASALDVAAQTALTNTGSMLAEKNLNATAAQLKNTGQLEAASLALHGTTLDNGGLIQGGQNLTLTAADLANRSGGKIISGSGLALSIPQLTNAGLISVQQGLAIDSLMLVNSGNIESQAMTLKAGQQVDNQASGALLAKDALSLSAGSFNNAGSLQGKNLAIGAGQWNNSGLTRGSESLTASVSGDLNNGPQGKIIVGQPDAQGVIAGGQFDLSAGSVTNEGWLQSGGGANVTVQALVNAGVISANQGATLEGLTLDNRGRIEAQDLQLKLRDKVNNFAGAVLVAKRNLQLSAPELDNAGQLIADSTVLDAQNVTNTGLLQGDSALKATGDTFNNATGGTVLAERQLTLAARQMTNAGEIQADSATLNAGQMTNSGKLLGLSILNLTATDSLVNTGKILGKDKLALTSGSLENQGTLAAADLSVDSQRNVNSGLLQGEKSLHLGATALNNLAQGKIISGSGLTLNIPTLINAGLISVEQGLTIGVAMLDNSGHIEGSDLQVTARERANNLATGVLLADNALQLSTPLFDNQGQVVSRLTTLDAARMTNGGIVHGSESLSLSGKTVSNARGAEMSGQAGELRVEQLVNAGLISVRQGMAIDALALQNSGNIEAGDLSLRLAQELDNQSGGVLLADNTLSVITPEGSNAGKLIANNTTLTVDDLTNNGLLQGNQSISSRGKTLTNGDTGQLLSDGSIAVNAGRLDNAGRLQGRTISLTGGQNGGQNTGQILGRDALNILFGGAFNNGGRLIGQNTLGLTTGPLSNTGIIAASALSLDTGSAQVNNSGLIQADGKLTFTAAALQNDKGATVAGGDDVTLTLPVLNNAGSISAVKHLQLNGGRLDNLGAIDAQNLDFNLSGQLNNLAGASLQADNRLAMTAGGWTNAGQIIGDNVTFSAIQGQNDGLLQGDSSLKLNATQFGNGAAGKVLTGGWLDMQGDQLSNQGLLQGQTLTLQGTNLSNTGSLSGKDRLSINTDKSVTNDGQILSQGELQLSTGQLDNNGVLAATRAGVQADTLHNLGTLQSNSTLDLHSAAVTNKGTLLAKQGLNITGTSLDNDGIVQGDTLTLALQNGLTNQATGKLLATGSLDYTGESLTNSGTVAADNARLAVNIFNNGGLVQGNTGLSLSGAGETRPQTMRLRSFAAAQPVVVRVLNNLSGGKLLSGGNLALTADSVDNAGAIQGQALTLAANRWNNDGSLIGLQAMDLNTGSLANHGQLAADSLGLKADSIGNSGLLQGTSAFTLETNRLENLTGGQILSGSSLALNLPEFTNAGTVQARDSLLLSADALDNQGRLSARDVTLNIARQLNNQSTGRLLASGELKSQSGTLGNSGVVAADKLELSSGQVDNLGVIQGENALALHTPQLNNLAGGQLVSGSSVNLTIPQMVNLGLISVKDALVLSGANLDNQGSLQGGSVALNFANSILNRSAAKILAEKDLSLQAADVNNQGTLAADTVGITANALNNAGLLQGNTALRLASATPATLTLTNQKEGQILTGGALTLALPKLLNQGVIFSSQGLSVSADTLENQGTLQGQDLTLNAANHLDNQQGARLVALRGLTLTGGQLDNAGQLAASNASLAVSILNNSGAVQGDNGLTVNGATLTNLSGGKMLTGGQLALNGQQISNAGVMQGQTLGVKATDWDNSGSALGINGLTAQVDNHLTNGGRLLSQGVSQITAGSLTNTGAVLSEGDLTLSGGALLNRGNIQGSNLTANNGAIDNAGSVIGLKSLTLQPQQDINNRLGGAMQTQGAMLVSGQNVTNGGLWQAQYLKLDAQQLQNNGTLQSTGNLDLALASGLTNSGSITANDAATVTAPGMTNQGQIQAKNLTLSGNSLNNGGTISGVDGLGISLGGNLDVQSGAKLLTNGLLSVGANIITNLGHVQGNAVTLNAAALSNQGRIEANSALTGTLSGSLDNGQNAVLLSQGSLDLGAQQLTNTGTVQGNGNTRIDLRNSGSNQGQLLSGGLLTLNTPGFTNGGWVQGFALTLNAGSLNNGGTVLAQQQGTIGGSYILNNGMLQGGNLTVNPGQLDNNGTVYATQNLGITASLVNSAAGARLLSQGNMGINAGNTSLQGQVAALGNLSLNSQGSYNQLTTLAAGNTLAVSSQGDINVNGLLQGQGVQLSAAGTLNNNGQVRAGYGESHLSAGQLNLNGAGSVQAGGTLRLTSQNGINNAGFVGTAGDLIASAGGTLLNSALLYAGNNMSLLANSIRNYRGDILAGNSLWMQRDAAGNANAEVVNTSGSIETQNGDISIRTLHLLNERDGFTYSESVQNYPGSGESYIYIRAGDIDPRKLAYYYGEKCTGGSEKNSGKTCVDTFSLKLMYPDQIKKLISEKTVTATAQGSAARISSGNNFYLSANQLENNASNLLARNNIQITGETLSNKSAISGKTSVYQVYSTPVDPLCQQYPDRCNNGWNSIPVDGSIESVKRGLRGDSANTIFKYALQPGVITETSEGDVTYRAVIQAGGAVVANFSNNISNTSVTANTPGYTPGRSAPGLNLATGPGVSAGTQATGLNAGTSNNVAAPQAAITLPANGNTVGQAENLTDRAGGNTGLATVDRSQQNIGDYGQAGGKLAAINSQGLNQQNGGSGSAIDLAANTTSLTEANNNGGKLTAISDNTVGLANQQAGNKSELATRDKNGEIVAVTTKIIELSSGGKTPPPPGYDYRPIELTDISAITSKLTASGSPVKLSDYPLPASDNGYFVANKDPKSPYLIVTNPKLDSLGQLDNSLFNDIYKLAGMAGPTAPQETRATYTDTNKFLGSDYFLARLNLRPDYDYRFLGDAAFDTRYVSNQILNQTGNRYVNGVGSDLEQMQYLIDHAAQARDKLGLKLGVSLSADQVAALDSSILWWENAVIDGQNVLVPKLYISPKDVAVNNGSVIAGNQVILNAGNITNDGSTLQGKALLSASSQNAISNINGGAMNSAGNLQLSALGDINNIGSTIAGQKVSLESVGGSIINQTLTSQWDTGGKASGRNNPVLAFTNTEVGPLASITAADGLSLSAGKDILNTGANLSAGGDMLLKALDDITITGNQLVDRKQVGSYFEENSGYKGSSITSGGTLSLQAGRDIAVKASNLYSENNVGLQAGRDVNLEAAESTHRDQYTAKKKVDINESVRQQGTEIASGGNTTIIAGRDVNTEAAQVTAHGDIGVGAGRDINLATATESDYHYDEETKTKKGFLSSKTTHTINETSSTHEAGTLLSGDNVTLKAGNDLLVKGSSVVGDGNVVLNAGNNVDIVAATETDTAWHYKETKKSGLMGTGGIGFTIGSSKSTHDLREQGTTQSQSVSTVGSTGGNVSVNAGGTAHIGGADLVASKDLSVAGDSVLIEPGHDKRTRDEKFEQKSTGLTVALSGAVGDAVNSAVETAQTTKNESDGRLAALQATKTALAGGQAYLNDQKAGADKDPDNGIRVSVSLTTQKSKSEQHAESDVVKGSTLTAGNDLSITATGKGNSADSGNILIGGSQLKAGGDTSLSASQDIVLGGAANTQLTTGKNSSSGGGIGVGFGVNSGSAGLSVFANVNAANGKDKGNGTSWTETTLDSGGAVSLTSGRDAILNGAQVNGDKVVAEIGRDLLIGSQQDSNNYDSKQTSMAAGGSYTWGTNPGASGSVSLSQDKMKSTYDSVLEQSGIFAGNGGFDITVGNHTQLNGAVIASRAGADKNSLDTGTLGFTDISNKADYSVSHSGVSLSGGTNISAGSMLATNGLANVGTLLAGMNGKGHAEGTTQSAVADGSITVRDKANQQQDVATLSRDTDHANGSIGQIFNKEEEQKRLQTAQLVGEIGGQMTGVVATYGDLQALDAVRAKDSKYASMSAAELRNTEDYQKAFGDYGIGGKYQMMAQSVSGILAGAAGGDFNKALAGGLNPVMAQAIKGTTEGNEPANLMAHAVWGALAAQLSGGNAAAGAAGAFSGELAARHIAAEMFPNTKPGDLNQDQKQLVSLLGTMAAGIAGGVVGNSTAAATTGAQAGKNAVENNYLSSKQVDDWSAEMKSCQASGGDCGGIIKKYEELSIAQQKQLISDCAASPESCQQKYGDVLTDSLAVKQAIDRALGEDIPIKMVYDLTATFAQQLEVEGVVATTQVSEALQKQYGLDVVQANTIAAAAATAFGGVSKAGKGSPLPTPIATPAKNGLNYQSNPKHTPGQQGYSFNAGTEPKNSIDLFGTSVVGGKKRYSIDAEGNVHQFTNTNDGTWHWSGSTGDKTVPLKKSDVPNSVKKEFGLPGKWR
ncbi:filamentous hemagglutinin N-terminal domain-containing protein [Enterobacter sp. Ap-1006]|uniref:hemagglutinin repeat-containing protein n=1 Tax=Enterobacter sp. Ap-1006 TaxID=2608345 RepID=UPI0014221791|nr:hemagglutinin repeat-containing protein [Enterobacter sp. Ap-1006]NIF47131.1 filamentous hemagglutinin N-terminal domain-containing protein [Enterobacter sp. Ap-1006]